MERFQIWATATSGYHQWQLELPLLVDGRRERFVVNNGGDAFRLVGIEGLPTYAWDRGQWFPIEMT